MDKDSYSDVYKDEETDELAEPEDEANVYCMWVNIKSARGAPVLHKIVSFRCHDIVVYLGVTFPEVPFKDHSALEVQTLDRELAQLSVSPEKQVKSRGKRSAPPTLMTRNRQAKCVLVLENYAPSNERQQMSGPLITFALASIDRIIDADNSDLISFPFLKLVAPEHLLHVTKYLNGLSGSTDVKFERFMLLSRPRVIEGDIEVRDEDNLRILVEGLGASSSKDGIVLFLRKLRTLPPPKRHNMHEYTHTSIDNSYDDDHLSLLDMLTTDPETTDAAPGWSQLR
ncbi:hypothetical protein GGH12_003007 [Coemansia sp. RSA 1822]|nr:hypothetical protein LPJ76_005161 [Coemansia sp. RSA 638]KAJ2121210.1 hypothetical protein IW147_004440 [Coemansia sp. RSA 720]KAJ2539682.1 hypothetical protein GGF49_005037 [Coemansia sp. RSA 1853]KAJ2562767.1 hypothetical protein GGH12_003007 [Coemansia sp. RSA 1822]